MSDSKLLAENTIRRFMKLANTGALSDNFVNEKFNAEELEEENELEEDTLEEAEEESEKNLEEQAEEDPEGEAMEDDDDEDMEMDMDLGEPEMDDEMGAADMSLTEEEARLLISLGERLSAAMGEEDPEEDDMDAELDMDADPEADMAADMDAPSDEEPAKAYMENISASEQQELVNEVLRRVTRRLVASRRK